MTPSSNAEHALWDYSLQIWQKGPAKAALLSCQDDNHLDINIILFSLWLGAEQYLDIAPLLEEALAISDEWQNNVLRNLRSARATLPKDSELKREILTAELSAEKSEQDQLIELAKRSTKPGNDISPAESAIANLCAYLNHALSSPQEIPGSTLISLAQAALPALSLEDIHNYFAKWSTR